MKADVPPDTDGLKLRAQQRLSDMKQRAAPSADARPEHEDRFRLMFERSADALLLIDAATNQFIDCNQAAADMLGCSDCSELLALHPSTLSPPFQPDGRASGEKADAMIATALLDGSHRFEWIHRSGHRDDFPVDVLLTVIEASDQPLILTTWRDISERQRNEAASRTILRAVEQSPASILITDSQANVLYVNPRFTDITGYAASEIIGRNPRILKSGQTTAETYRQLWDTLLSGGVWEGNFINQRKNGEVYWEHATISAVIDPSGAISSYVEVSEDITGRLLAEEALRSSRAYLADLGAALDGTISVATTDADGRITSVNAMFCKLSGYSADELLGCDNRILSSGYHPAKFFKDLWDTIQAGRIWHGEIRNKAKDGHLYWVSAIIVPQPDQASVPQGYLVLRNDITERRQAEQTQKALLEIAAAAQSVVTLPDLFRRIHVVIESLLPAKNFFVALRSIDTDTVTYAYFVDERDPIPEPSRLDDETLTGRVILSGTSLLLNEQSRQQEAMRTLPVVGTPSQDWLGVPLKSQASVIGALVVQSYTGDVLYTHEHQSLLELVSSQIAATIERFQAIDALRKSEARLSGIIESATDAIISLDAGHRIVLFNPAAEVMFGFRAAEMLGQSLDRLIPQGLRERHRRHVEEFGHSNVPAHPMGAQRNLAGVRSDGSEFPIEASQVTQTLAGDQKIFTVILRDITARQLTENKLRLAASVFTNAREGILITDAKGRIVEVNDTFTAITGYSREEALDRSHGLLGVGLQAAESSDVRWLELAREGQWHGEIWSRRKNGEIYAELNTTSAVRDAAGNTEHYVSLFSDITPMKEYERQLEHIVHYDHLTGLPNRVLLADRLTQAMLQSQRHNMSLAVVYLDLDGFKAINDEHGHEIGDGLLIAAARRMQAALRDGDTLARLGGDEFVVVVVELVQPQECEPVLARLLQAVADPVRVGDLELRVSASIGVTIYPQDGADADQLLRHADQAMYLAKQAGKNCYRLFDVAQDLALKTQREIQEEIRHAIDRSELVLYYQPKVNMKTGAVIGAEALIRWQHPQRGLLLPAAFLPQIDEHPISIALGEWVIDAALAQMRQWLETGLDVQVSVNIGALQLQQSDFVAKLTTAIAAHAAVQSHRLELEILETCAMEDIAKVSDVIAACRAINVRFALDDFGTGYSSLTYLRRLPAELLKIDRSFVSHMLDDPGDLAIVEGVVGLATAFNREVLAEGVETEAHGTRLLQLGCELAQGYFIARPMPARELPNWVATWKPAAAWTSTEKIR